MIKRKIQIKKANSLSKTIRILVCCSILSLPLTLLHTKNSYAALCIPCAVCLAPDPAAAMIVSALIKSLIWEPIILENIEDHLNSEENWIVEDFFEDFWVKGLAELTEFLGAFGMYQVQMVGTFFDAKNQLETRRLHFTLQAEAHKDYQPSDDFCWFGTNSRSMVSTEARAGLNMLGMSQRALQRHVGHQSSASYLSSSDEKNSRWAQFIKTYCDPKDNAWSTSGTGLDLACDRDGSGPSTATGATDKNRVNRDIDYTRLIDEPRTLDINFSDATDPVSADEEDVLAMASNLYGNDILSRRLSHNLIKKPAAKRLYMDLRSIEAKRNVAENSYNAIVSMKSSGTSASGGGSAQPDVGSFMAALIKDIMPTGTPDNEIFAIMGENPSYYAQLELLSKKIYQNTDFFTNLYDTPANVKRKSTAMKAISLMLDRALYESELRQEMLLSVMLSSNLNDDYTITNHDLKQGYKNK